MTETHPSGRDPSFRFDYHPATIRFGTGSVDDLAAELETRGLESALVVCGSTVGSTPTVIEPVKAGLGDRLAGVFDETTPNKRLSTALEARDRLHATDADAIVALGGGSSLDVATAASVLAASDLGSAAAGREFEETGTLPVPGGGEDEGKDDDGELVPIVTIPTTLAGAELSHVAGLTAHPNCCPVDEAVSGGISDPALTPAAAVYDPELVATTPDSILAGSAMNGFDKGIETLYAANATPITDATARHGLEKLEDGLRAFGDGDRGVETLETILEGIVLVQYGITRPGETTLSIVHAFGHALTRTDDVQQGAAHAVVVPHVLEYLFDEPAVDARSGMLANALGVDDAADHDAAVIDAVTEIRDGLGLPSKLRNVDGPQPEAFEAVAEAVLADAFMANAPPGLDPTVEEIEAILEAAW
ncbi:iron-containing alcohol dehydrogenase family protein [Natronolimnohabitans innermongolicus]|uniref:Iron-containing alcohol dehydrogenase n=1 Tax=Natronolimnohabitans innermongolicus JCM 12255 TaxID=1227499 RepID=L9XHR5_9EURY|nr:iron-containing alcohol dehydrogenase family protein [Natronolimnohabitans innermongolicus]ELY61284.1 iron-containing alcohol dehydrogenase [Natronolimnohabitans innermongolicus JCM 12255]